MGQGQMGATTPSSQEVDQALLMQLEAIVVAAAAALEQLRSGEPLTVTEPDDFFRAIRGDDQPQPAVSVPAGAYVA